MSTEQDGIERTEAPSPRWVAQVHARGAWPSSRELVTSCAVLAGILVFRFAGSTLIGQLSSEFSTGLGNKVQLVGGVDLASGRGWMFLHAWRVVPFLVLPLLVAIFTGLTQTGGRFRSELLGPQLERFSGFRTLQQIIGGSAMKATAFALIKFLTLFLFAAWSLTSEIIRLHATQGSATQSDMEYAVSVPVRVLTGVALLMVALGIVDYGWAWVRHLSQLRMTRAQLAAELREMEGDPINRRRLRQKRMSGSPSKWDKLLQRGDMLLAGGRLVLAIRFREHDQATVHAKLVGTVADALIRAGQGRGVMIVRDLVLARRVAERGKVGEDLPADLVDEMAKFKGVARQDHSHATDFLAGQKTGVLVPFDLSSLSPI